jgi:hypothetical protein
MEARGRQGKDDKVMTGQDRVELSYFVSHSSPPVHYYIQVSFIYGSNARPA